MSDLTGAAEKSRSAKIALRSQLLAHRRTLTPSPLQDQTLALVRRAGASTVAAYVPVGTEPGGPDLIPALAAHCRVLLPVLRPDNDLDWAVYTDSLIAGPRGLLEPPGPRLGVDAIATAELVLVPALAVDHHGRRLGRGGGSYDRALTRVSPDALVVALLHDSELVDDVPAEEHDRPVHGVVTPGRGFTLSTGVEWTK